MKAILCTDRGAAADTLSIAETDQPTPKPGEVLVALRASGVNPSDVKLRSGMQGPMVADRVIIHNDGAGVVEAVGEGVDPSRIGQRVWLYNVNRSADGLGQGVIGTAAGYVSVPNAQAPLLPESASFEVGACIGVPAMTAHRAVMWAGSIKGKTLLVTGGAGSVGHCAIQIAKGMGAAVITTVSSDTKAAIAREAGADVVINYRIENLTDRIIEEVGPGGIDHVADVDFAAHVDIYPNILKLNGTVGAYATATNLTPAFPFYPLAFRNIRIQPIFVYAMADNAKQDAIRDINTLLTQEALVPRVDTVFDFDEVVAAHEAVEGGKLVGNAILKV